MARVLVIDADHQVRSRVTQYLEMQGHTVATAGSGADGTTLFRREPPDVAIVSVELRDIDGLQLARELTQQSPVKVIIMTSSEGARLDEVRRAARDFGLFNFFRKPVLLNALSRQVERLAP